MELADTRHLECRIFIDVGVQVPHRAQYIDSKAVIMRYNSVLIISYPNLRLIRDIRLEKVIS